MIEFYYIFVLDTTFFWSEIWFMPHMWRKCGKKAKISRRYSAPIFMMQKETVFCLELPPIFYAHYYNISSIILSYIHYTISLMTDI